MLRTFCGTEDTSPKSNLKKGKKSSAGYQRTGCCWRKQILAIAISEGKGIEPLPLARARMTSYTAVRDLAVQRLSQPSHFSTTTASSGVVRISCQSGHIRKKRWRLTDEETHVRQELQYTRGNTFRLGWSND
jgi:hypothetical protein